MTTFNLPDLQQRFPLGRGTHPLAQTIGSSGGTLDHAHAFALSPAHLPPHAHTFSATTSAAGDHLHTQVDSAGTLGGASGGTQFRVGIAPQNQVAYGGHSHTVSGTTSTSGSGQSVTTSSENPPFLVVNYIIRF